MQETSIATQEVIERGKTHNPFNVVGGLMRILLPSLLIGLLAPVTVALAQDASKAAAPSSADNPISSSNKLAYGFMKFVMLKSAEKMPEEHYNFKPTWVVRSFGKFVGHVADSQYYFCSRALGEKNTAPNIEQTKTSKADLIAALKESFAYCDKAYSRMTDAEAAQMTKFGGLDIPKLFVLTANNLHTAEHYGNLIIYLRMKNIVPPSTEGGFDPRAQK
jgi:uncharacterized damage-inducible protein DinB